MAAQAKEWMNGFLFVGNHPSLDLLNTRLVNAEGPVELLPDPGSLARWVTACGIARDRAAIDAMSGWNASRPARRFHRELLTFREELRTAVLQREAGKAPVPFIGILNEKLLQYPRRHVLRRAKKLVEWGLYLELDRPADLWREIAGSASELLTEVPISRVRKCEGCVVHFHDISKKNSRRWCSTHMCGNRDKVKAYRQRRRATEE